MKSTGWTFVAGLLGLAIAAPWTIPFAELVREGVTYKTTADGPRIRGMSLSQGRDVLPLALFGPGSLLHGAHISALDKVKPWILGQALGPVTLALAIGGLWIGRLKRALGVVLILGVALTLAPKGLGWLYNAPMLGVVLPWYAWPLVAFPVAFAAGGAIHAMMQRRSPRRLLLGPVFVVLATIWVAWWLPTSRATILQPADWALKAATTLRWAFAVHVLVVLTTTGLAVYLWRKRPRASAAMVSTLALVELAIVIWPYPRPHRTRALATTPPIVAYLVSEQARTHGRVVARGMTGLPNIPTTYGIADFRSTTGVAIRRERSYFSLIATPTMTFHLVKRPGSPLLDAAAVTTWVEPTQRSKPPQQWLVPGYRLAFTGPAAAVYINENALPRARIVHNATFVDGEANALQELKTLQHDRAALIERVVLEARPDSVILAGGALTADERVDIISAEDPDQMVLEAQLARDGLVVLADTYYPGWRAYVDGHEQSIWAANVMFRAIAVPAGKHNIIFRYEPRSLQLGSGLAGAGSALCLGILLWTRKRRYRALLQKKT
jgi:hypothetical protein